jgi:hypothetical protein
VPKPPSLHIGKNTGADGEAGDGPIGTLLESRLSSARSAIRPTDSRMLSRVEIAGDLGIVAGITSEMLQVLPGCNLLSGLSCNPSNATDYVPRGFHLAAGPCIAVRIATP